MTLVAPWDAVEQEHQMLLADRLAGWAEKYPDIPVQKAVERDRPARVLVEESARAQLLVVGSHGRGNVAGRLLRRSTSRCAAHCPERHHPHSATRARPRRRGLAQLDNRRPRQAQHDRLRPLINTSSTESII
jgi:hypothetical protein